MSTDFRPLKHIAFPALFNGRLEKYGVREEVLPNTTARLRYLVGGAGALAVYRTDSGGCEFNRSASLGPVPGDVLRAIQEEFEAEIVSEYDHRFWGFNSEEEWDAALEALPTTVARKDQVEDPASRDNVPF